MTASTTLRTREKLLYTGKTHTVGGREHGTARSSDGQLDIRFSPPGSGRPGTSPEQMLAAGWPACFEGAIGLAAQLRTFGSAMAFIAAPPAGTRTDLNRP